MQSHNTTLICSLLCQCARYDTEHLLDVPFEMSNEGQHLSVRVCASHRLCSSKHLFLQEDVLWPLKSSCFSKAAVQGKLQAFC